MAERLREIKEKVLYPLRRATLLFLLKDNQILLAIKKEGFGQGKWNGIGGKQGEGETIEQTARRESFEEIKVTPGSLKEVAVLDFYFLNNPEWNQQVLVFIAKKWTGNPVESEEMKPQWLDTDNLPFGEMWEDDSIWLPKVLGGQKVSGSFLFDENQKLVEFEIT